MGLLLLVAASFPEEAIVPAALLEALVPAARQSFAHRLYLAYISPISRLYLPVRASPVRVRHPAIHCRVSAADGLGQGARRLASQPGMRMLDAPRAPFAAQEPLLEERVQAERVRAERAAAEGAGAQSHAAAAAAQPQVRVRRCLRTLLRMSLLSGSIREGIQVHDLRVRVRVRIRI